MEKRKQSKLNLRLRQALWACLWILMAGIILSVGFTILQHVGEGGISCGDVPVGSDLQYFADHVTYDYSRTFCQSQGWQNGWVNSGQGIAVRCYTQEGDTTKNHDYPVQYFVNWLKVQDIVKENTTTKNASEGL